MASLTGNISPIIVAKIVIDSNIATPEMIKGEQFIFFSPLDRLNYLKADSYKRTNLPDVIDGWWSGF